LEQLWGLAQGKIGLFCSSEAFALSFIWKRTQSGTQNRLKFQNRTFISGMTNQSEPFGWSITSSCRVFPVSRDGTIAGWIIRREEIKSERPLVGWLSCRMLSCVRPVTATGQDEVIFHPSTMNEMVWMLIDGITPLRSKGELEMGKWSLERFGGPKLSNDDFEKVNENR
jgi:hypothetical protein